MLLNVNAVKPRDCLDLNGMMLLNAEVEEPSRPLRGPITALCHLHTIVSEKSRGQFGYSESPIMAPTLISHCGDREVEWL